MEMTLLQHPVGSGLLCTPSQELPTKPRVAGIKRKAASGEPHGRPPKGSNGRTLLLGELQDPLPPPQWLQFRHHSLQHPLTSQPPTQQPQHQKPSPQCTKDGQTWTQIHSLLHHPQDQQPPELQAARGWCDLCKLNCVTHHNLKLHVQGKKHKAKWDELSSKAEDTAKSDELSLRVCRPQSRQRPEIQTALVWCNVCEVNCMNPQNLKRHLQGRKHKAKWDKRSLEAGHEDDVYLRDHGPDDQQQLQVQESPVWCTLCKLNCMNSRNLKRHLLGKKHKAKWDEQPLQAYSSHSEQAPQIQAAPVWCKSLQVGTAL